MAGVVPGIGLGVENVADVDQTGTGNVAVVNQN